MFKMGNLYVGVNKMKNVRVLDCTLRDGGRIIDCAFPDNEIKKIAGKLASAKIDIIEVGFLRDQRKVDFKGDSTFFTDVDQITGYLDKSSADALFVAFIDYGMFEFSSLRPHDGNSIDGIRFGFTKKDYTEHYEDVLNCARIIKEKGYKLFIQGVNSLNYSDREILELIDMINLIKPYSFGIVDTYGAMYIDDVDRLYGLIDRNMDSDICINFHSHNNYQLSFGFAQEVIKLAKGSPRQVIIDATLSGMGKVAGNLNTELIVDYLVRKLHYDYDLDTVLDIIDDYIYKYAQKHKWGYSIPALMAGIYKSHPNNIIYLTEKFRLETKDIGNLLSMISPDKRQRYDYDNIERIYVEYIADKVDDSEVIAELRQKISGREVVVMAPGNTLNTYREIVDRYIYDNAPIVISVNFVADYPKAWAFFGNKKRYNMLENDRIGRTVIAPSNVERCGGVVRLLLITTALLIVDISFLRIQPSCCSIY
ncbi:MAG: aldolase catalytic domain-containing protein [Prevotella sp.]|nr:aldolase catalytic domain-containing protein [Prevotella sp.]